MPLRNRIPPKMGGGAGGSAMGLRKKKVAEFTRSETPGCADNRKCAGKIGGGRLAIVEQTGSLTCG